MDEEKEKASFSMAGCDYSVDDIDRDAEKKNMSRSKFIQHLYIAFKEKKRFMEKKFVDFTTLLLLLVIVLGVVILLLRV